MLEQEATFFARVARRAKDGKVWFEATFPDIIIVVDEKKTELSAKGDSVLDAVDAARDALTSHLAKLSDARPRQKFPQFRERVEEGYHKIRAIWY